MSPLCVIYCMFIIPVILALRQNSSFLLVWIWKAVSPIHDSDLLSRNNYMLILLENCPLSITPLVCKVWFQTTSISYTWELVKNIQPLSYIWLALSKTRGVGLAISLSLDTSPSSDSQSLLSLRITCLFKFCLEVGQKNVQNPHYTMMTFGINQNLSDHCHFPHSYTWLNI